MKTLKRNDNSKLIATQIASMYLLKKKTITLSEIKALPFINDQNDVKNILYYLNSNFHLHKESITVQNEPYLVIDTVFKLVSEREYS